MIDLEVDERAQGLRKDIIILEEWCKTLGDNDDDGIFISAQLISTHYIIVTAYGIIESEMKRLLNKYVSENSNQEVASAMEFNLSKRYSWNYQNIKDILSEFRRDWRERVKESLSDEQILSINSLKNSRDKIAHGDSNDATLHDAKSQFISAVEALHIISEILHEPNS